MSGTALLERSSSENDTAIPDRWDLIIVVLVLLLVILTDEPLFRRDGQSQDTGTSGPASELAGVNAPIEAREPSDYATYVNALRTLREEIERSGEHLLSWEELEREVAERRGEKSGPAVT